MTRRLRHGPPGQYLYLVTKSVKMTPAQRTAKARALLAVGARLRTVLRECGISQVTIARRARLGIPRVSLILGSPDAARKQGRDATEKVYRTAAALLGLLVAAIPEYDALDGKEPVHEHRSPSNGPPRRAATAD